MFGLNTVWSIEKNNSNFIPNYLMKKVFIIGGGLSGLSCGSYLSNAGYEVTITEASPKLGGRAYSFIDRNSSDTIDNGQHIMMGAYRNTLNFLNLISAEDTISIQSKLKVVFCDKNGVQHHLKSDSENYPINIIKALLSYSALTIKERLRVLDLFLDLVFIEETDLTDTTVKEWLEQEHQDENSIRALWEILAIGTLNSTINEASAAVFVNVLKKVFLDGNDSAKIILPKVGLSDMYCSQAEKFITGNNGSIHLSEKVLSVEEVDGSINIITSKGEYHGYDYLVSSLPLHAIGKISGILNNPAPLVDVLKYSPIVSAHIWIKENNFSEEFYGLIDSRIHWLFNHGSYVTLVTSAAYELVKMSDEEIFNIICDEISKNFAVFFHEIVLSYKIIKEKRATFIPTAESIKLRNRITTAYSNIILCGDWTEKMLPATIESAVLSGRKAASRILDKEF